MLLLFAKSLITLHRSEMGMVLQASQALSTSGARIWTAKTSQSQQKEELTHSLTCIESVTTPIGFPPITGPARQAQITVVIQQQ